jgi:hypothetical protein
MFTDRLRGLGAFWKRRRAQSAGQNELSPTQTSPLLRLREAKVRERI